jgi:hypothetical protein
MRRLNVRSAQIDECIQKSLFAIPYRPQNPELQPGELLLLQLVKDEARRLGQEHERINFALMFEKLEPDPEGTLSRLHWPKENRTWPWIVYGSATVPTVPFSLEDLHPSKSYEGQTNPMYLDPQDEQLVLPFIQWNLAEMSTRAIQIVPTEEVAQRFGKKRALATIYNHDRIAVLHPVKTRQVTVLQFIRNQALVDGLKAYYECRCQICGQDFEPKYGVPFAETHHIQYLHEGGADISTNIIVICPNHHQIIHAANAYFNRDTLTYEYRNGLLEPLQRTDHFVQAPLFDRLDPKAG